MGFSMVVFEATISSRVYELGDETSMLSKIGRIMVYVLGFYLIIRFQNIFIRGQMANAFSGTFLGNMFLLENLMMIIGLIILAYPSYRNNRAHRP